MVLDVNAGQNYAADLFARNNFYFNGGVCLINVRKYREDNLYYKAYLSTIAYNYFGCPFQTILLIISNFQFSYLPLNYNSPQIFENDEEKKMKNKATKIMNIWLTHQINSIFRQTKNELIESGLHPVLSHLFCNKPYEGKANINYTRIWINYAKKLGLFHELKKKYPLPFGILEKYNLKNN